MTLGEKRGGGGNRAEDVKVLIEMTRRDRSRNEKTWLSTRELPGMRKRGRNNTNKGTLLSVLSNIRN